MKIIVYCDITPCSLVEWHEQEFGRNLLFPFCTTKREMGSFSESFVPFYRTGDVTSQNPVILTTTSVTTLNRGGDILESSNPYNNLSDHVK
jgi:hypothetical protein